MTSPTGAVVGSDRLPSHNLIETLDKQAIAARLAEAFRAHFPDWSEQADCDPVRALVNISAYQHLLLRQRINDAAAACLLATASGTDLDLHGFGRNVIRKVLVAADPTANPPLEEVLESDDDYRLRIQRAPESWSVAGSEKAYVFFAKAVDGVRDAAVRSDEPSEVTITVTSDATNGVASPELLDAVAQALEDLRPIGDKLTVQSV